LIVPLPVTTPSPGMCLLGHAEIGAVMLDIHVGFFKAAFVEQDRKPLARGQLALGVLRIDALLPAPSAARRGVFPFRRYWQTSAPSRRN
jgi:hypothetical protein